MRLNFPQFGMFFIISINIGHKKVRNVNGILIRKRIAIVDMYGFVGPFGY